MAIKKHLSKEPPPKEVVEVIEFNRTRGRIMTCPVCGTMYAASYGRCSSCQPIVSSKEAWWRDDKYKR